MLSILLLLIFICQCYSQMGMGGPGGGSAKKGVVNKKDLPLISCEACEYVVRNAYDEVAKKRSELTLKKKLEEMEVENVIEGICKPDGPYGSWIRTIDIVPVKEKGNTYLKLSQPGGSSKCKNECETIAKSCKNLLDEEIDIDNLSSLLFRGVVEKQQAVEKICHKLKRCKRRLPLTGKDGKREDEEFEEISEKDLEMEKVMAQMKDAGLGGSMYNRDDLAGMMGGDGLDDYDDPYGGGDMGDMPYGGDMGEDADNKGYEF